MWMHLNAIELLETEESALSLIQSLLKLKDRFPLTSEGFESAKS